MVRRLYRFFAASLRRSSSPVIRWSNSLSRSTDARDLEGGRAQQADAFADLPVEREP